MESSTETANGIDFGEHLIDSSLINQISSDRSPLLEKEYLKKDRTQLEVSNENLMREPMYEINCIYHSYDFLFDTINYQTNNKIKESKTIRNLPRHIRNTLFLRSKTIKKIRKMQFDKVFMICEEIKEIANKYYQNKDYFNALERYNLVYSLFKWIEIKDKHKEQFLFNNINTIRSNPITDDDIIFRIIKYNKNNSNENSNFKNSICFTLKALSYCYFNLKIFTQAEQCLDEAIKYETNALPELYYHKAQAIMFNKESSIEKLNEASEALLKANLKDDIRIEEHITLLNKIKNEKKMGNVNRIKILLHNFRYAYNVIRRKKLDMKSIISGNYEINHLNYKIMKEINDTYKSTLKKYFKMKNIIEYNKGLNEYQNFLTNYNEYDFYYNYHINTITKDDFNMLTFNEQKDVELIRSDSNLKDLFDEFRFKKCDNIYMNMKFNSKLWEKCYETVLEQQKLLDDTNEERKKWNLIEFNKNNAMVQIINAILRIANLEINENNYRLYMYLSIIVILIVGIIAMLLFY